MRYQKYFVEILLNRLISLPTLWFNISFLLQTTILLLYSFKLGECDILIAKKLRRLQQNKDNCISVSMQSKQPKRTYIFLCNKHQRRHKLLMHSRIKSRSNAKGIYFKFCNLIRIGSFTWCVIAYAQNKTCVKYFVIAFGILFIIEILLTKGVQNVFLKPCQSPDMFLQNYEP